jgi:DNA-binding LacI/PurR family transcriptional regulator
VKHPHRKLGEVAAEELLKMMDNSGESFGDVIFKPDLVIRNSVKIIENKEAAEKIRA